MFLICRQMSTVSRAVRVRFAPSPTGEMHLGGLRTALYNYLFARKHRGTFILRIEDTDQSRLVAGAQQRLVDNLRWAGLVPDEGPGDLGGSSGPYAQSERLHFYREFVQKLEDKGAAYKCFCSQRRLDILKKDANRRKQIFKYDNKCRNLTEEQIKQHRVNGTPHVVRFKLKPGPVTFHDMIHKSTTLDLSQSEADFIILKSDGYPTYHLANVVDDHLMGISHVLRGVEWQISTPKHLQMFEALGIPPPMYAHLPLMMNHDGTKLSKRNQGFMCDQLKGKYLPEAVLNFMLLSGGGFSTSTGDFYRLDELVDRFDLESMNTNSCKVDLTRLDGMNHQAIKCLAEELQDDAFNLLKQHHPHVKEDHFRKAFHSNIDRITLLDDLLSPTMSFLWVKSSSKESLPNDLKIKLRALTESLETSAFEKGELTKLLREFHKNNFDETFTFAQYMSTLRRLLSGLREGPGVAEIMEAIGKEETIERLSEYL